VNISELPINLSKLLPLILREDWHEKCEILPDYMPKYPREDTRPSVQVRYNDGSKRSSERLKGGTKIISKNSG
jgi:hypothetical protein